MQINGIAHVMLTVTRFEVAREFYGKVLGFLEFKPVIDGDGMYYCLGGRTAIGIQRGLPPFTEERFEQSRVGLHHICLRARSREDVDAFHAFLVEIGAEVVHPPQEDPWAPGYYSVLFEDPDGIRLEMNHVPGRGLLADI